MNSDGKSRIVKLLEQHKSMKGAELCDALGISRQALNQHMKALVAAGRVVRTGATRGAKYHHPEALAPSEPRSFTKQYALQDLQEDVVWEQVSVMLGLSKLLAANVHEIVTYAFTEMLNNAIDHSRSAKAQVDVVVDRDTLCFTIRDWGVGIFETIRDKMSLDDEPHALTELIKGKTTTMPDRHTGEGIFFTSRAADFFRIHSHKLTLIRDRSTDDVYAGEARHLKGTSVEFRVSLRTTRKLRPLFDTFAPERHDYKFSVTHVRVELVKDHMVSRSEAKRLLSGLDRFKEIELDLRRVQSIGQGFADELFRVFKEQHADVEIRVENANPAVQAMIDHVRR